MLKKPVPEPLDSTLAVREASQEQEAGARMSQSIYLQYNIMGVVCTTRGAQDKITWTSILSLCKVIRLLDNKPIAFSRQKEVLGVLILSMQTVGYASATCSQLVCCQAGSYSKPLSAAYHGFTASETSSFAYPVCTTRLGLVHSRSFSKSLYAAQS